MSTDTDLAAAVSDARRMVENPIGLHGWAVNLARCFLSFADRDPVATISVPDRRDERTERAMIDAKKRVYEVAAQLFGDGVCCTDHGCVFGHPGGMGTNGGCQHIKERDGTDLRRTVQKLAAVARALATADLTARVDKVRDESGPAPGWELVDPSRKKYGRVGGLTNKSGTWADYDDEHGYAPHVAAATAELRTENERLRGEIEEWKRCVTENGRSRRRILRLCASTSEQNIHHQPRTVSAPKRTT